MCRKEILNLNKLTCQFLIKFNKLQRVVFLVILPFELYQNNCYPFKQIGGYDELMEEKSKSRQWLFMGVHKYMIK